MENIETRELKIGNDTKIEDREPEIWKDIKDYEGYYQVSDYGRVRSVPRMIYVTRESKPHTRYQKGIILKPCLDKYGYFRVVLSQNKTSKCVLVSRLVALAFLLPVKNKLCVNHKDGIKINNFYLNLEWVTNQENMDHAAKMGLVNNRGQNGPRSTLTDNTVRQIRIDRKSGLKFKDIAVKNNTKICIVENIIYNKAWKYV